MNKVCFMYLSIPRIKKITKELYIPILHSTYEYQLKIKKRSL